jgi:hypothetical protein
MSSIPIDTLREKADKSGIPLRALIEVYKKGLGAFYTNPSSPAAKGVTNAPQWAFGRVNAFISKRPTVYTGADNHIRLKYHLEK